MSFEGTETFIPPKAVSCGVLGSFKKLNTELPPIVCAYRAEENKTDNIKMIGRKGLS